MGKIDAIELLMETCPNSDELLDSRGQNALHRAIEHKERPAFWGLHFIPGQRPGVHVLGSMVAKCLLMYAGLTAVHGARAPQVVPQPLPRLVLQPAPCHRQFTFDERLAVCAKRQWRACSRGPFRSGWGCCWVRGPSPAYLKA
ncbi:unnamed protein product [Urochloa humidicola]